MSTPGRRRALRALAGARRSNERRVARGEKPVIGGRKVTAATLAKHGGPGSATEARRRLMNIAKRR